MMPGLSRELDIKELFSRMDNNGDGVVDLTDFLMWEERMQDGRGNTDYWALQEVPLLLLIHFFNIHNNELSSINMEPSRALYM